MTTFVRLTYDQFEERYSSVTSQAITELEVVGAIRASHGQVLIFDLEALEARHAECILRDEQDDFSRILGTKRMTRHIQHVMAERLGSFVGSKMTSGTVQAMRGVVEGELHRLRQQETIEDFSVHFAASDVLEVTVGVSPGLEKISMKVNL